MGRFAPRFLCPQIAKGYRWQRGNPHKFLGDLGTKKHFYFKNVDPIAAHDGRYRHITGVFVGGIIIRRITTISLGLTSKDPTSKISTQVSTQFPTTGKHWWNWRSDRVTQPPRWQGPNRIHDQITVHTWLSQTIFLICLQKLGPRIHADFSWDR